MTFIIVDPLHAPCPDSHFELELSGILFQSIGLRTLALFFEHLVDN